MNPDRSYWQDRRVVVTGGTGFLGGHLVRQLCGMGARVRVLALPARTATAADNDGTVELVNGDICDRSLVRSALADAEVVFHAAGIVAVWGPALKRLRNVHVQGTQNVLDAAPSSARIVHTSSLVAVGATLSAVPLTEGAPFPANVAAIPYAAAKRESEEIALGSGRDVVVTNPGTLIGPEDDEPSVMGRFCRRYWKGHIPFAPPGGFNFVDVRDVATAHLLAAEHGTRGERYLLGGENHTFHSILALLAEVAGYRPRWSPQLSDRAMQLLAVAAETRSYWSGKEPYPSFGHVQINRLHWYCRSDRARTQLGFAPRPVRESLADAYVWHAQWKPFQLGRISRWWMRQRAAA